MIYNATLSLIGVYLELTAAKKLNFNVYLN